VSGAGRGNCSLWLASDPSPPLVLLALRYAAQHLRAALLPVRRWGRGSPARCFSFGRRRLSDRCSGCWSAWRWDWCSFWVSFETPSHRAWALSQGGLYLLKYRRSARLPWEHVREVVREGQSGCPAPFGYQPPGMEGTRQRDSFAPRQLGTGTAELLESLQGFALDPSSRQRLPTDEDLRARIEKK